jgi:hypothetical protein
MLLLYGIERRPSLAPLQIALEVRLPHTSSSWNIVHSHLDNLRDDTQYITSWISAGWSECRTHSSYRLFITDIYPANDVMTYVSFFSLLGLKLLQ